MESVVRKGYQRLEQNFFNLCKTRELNLGTSFFYLYLRGLYCRLGKPIFYCKDTILMADMNTSPDTIRRMKKELKIKGLIDYQSGKNKGSATEYKMLDSVLLPPLKLRAFTPYNKGLRTANCGASILKSNTKRVNTNSKCFSSSLNLGVVETALAMDQPWAKR